MNLRMLAPLCCAAWGVWLLGLANLAASDPPKAAPLTERKQQQLQKAKRLGEQAEKLRAEGKLDQAITAMEERLTLEREVWGSVHEDVLRSLEQLADLHLEREDFAKARTVRQAVLDLRSKLRGEGHFSVLDARLDLADVDFLSRLPAEERSRLRQANELMKQVAELHKQARFREALPLVRQALQIRRTILGPNHIDTASSLSDLAELLSRVDEYAEAWRSAQEALAVKEKVLGKNHPDTAVTLNNIGALLARQGNFAAARAYLEQASTIFQTTLGEEDPDVASSLNNVGSLLESQGDYAAARPYFERALAMQKKILGEQHPDIVPMLNNLGMLLMRQHDYGAARRYLEQALQIRQKTLGPNHADTGRSINNLAGLLYLQGNYAAAQPYFEQALEIERKTLGENDPNTAMVLDNLGGALYSQGKYAAALPYLEKALAIRQSVLGENHPDTARSLTGVGFARFTERDYVAARKYLERALAAHLALEENLLESLSEAEALAHVEIARSDRDPILSVLRQLPQSKPEEAYAPLWSIRGAASRALAARRNVAATVPEARELWQALRQTCAQLATLTLRVPAPEQAKSRQERLAKLNAEKERLERALAKISAPYRRQRASQRATFRDLAARLPKNVALLDLVHATIFEPPPADKGGAMRPALHYEAFVLRKADVPSGYRLAWIHLGPAEPIDQAVRTWRQSLQLAAAPATSPEAPERILRRLIWEPIETHLDGCSTVVILPDAALFRIPWAALPGKKPGSFLLEEYAIATASDGPQLYDLLNREPLQAETCLVVGGIQYDAALPAASVPKMAIASRAPARDAKAELTWPYLPGSLREAEQIMALWKKPEQGRLLTGRAASEAALREELPKARYVHLATHGFFADPAVPSAFRHEMTREKLLVAGFEMAGQQATVTGRNPLILSGIVLASANLPQSRDEWGATVGDDGILTAEEVVALDLSGTELAVLSACETGLGEVAGGEGVFGLQRAFHLAGARTVVASLWKVDDRAAQALMSEFYRNLWQKGHGKLEALRQAQLAMLRSYDPQAGRLRGPQDRTRTDPNKPARKAEERLPPFFWAAFVLSGDWR